MGIFGNDKEQDQRIEALEAHVRLLTETVQTNQADLAMSRIAILALQASVADKVSAGDVDPAIVKLNQQLATAREDLEQSSRRPPRAGTNSSRVSGELRDLEQEPRQGIRSTHQEVTIAAQAGYEFMHPGAASKKENEP